MLGKVSRKIAIDTWDRLAWAIIDTYDFDGDHSYEFVFQERNGAAVSALRPEVEDGESTTEEWSIGALPLAPGQSMMFVYDFGANWRFRATLEKIDPNAKRPQKPKVIASRGKAPSEYGDW